VRPMRLSDLPAVMETDRRSLPKPWSEAIWREELSSPFGLYLVLEEGGALSGHVGIKLIFDEAHVMTLAVRPERRRRGLARTLVEAALADPTSAGARWVYLEVRTSNLAARALYGSLGFSETGVRPRYYGDEDALLMTLDLVKSRR
jgi:[ribosomal protein S18]-alanine N-acetyltransferase